MKSNEEKVGSKPEVNIFFLILYVLLLVFCFFLCVSGIPSIHVLSEYMSFYLTY